MALPIRPSYNLPIPNNPFFSPEAYIIQGAYYPMVVGAGISVSAGGVITSTGGGGGSGTVTSVIAGTGLTGGTITTSGTIDLANTAVTPGAYTLANITIDAQGRITAAANGSGITSVTGTAPIVSSGGATPAISLANTTVTPGAYTAANITIDAQGRITAAASGSGVVNSTGGGYVDNAITRYDGTTGSLIQNSLVTINDSGAINAPNNTGSMIPFYYASQASFPAASGSHGAIAHSHSDGKMYYAHGGVWIELANDDEIIPDTILTAKGQLIVAVAAGIPVALPVGANATVLTADSTCASGIKWATGVVVPLTAITGTAPIAVTAGTTPVVSIAASSTTASGAVQLYNDVNSTSTALALTAAQGKVLQDQITGLVLTGTIALAGTIDAATGLLVSVTSKGTIDGYVIGAVLPAASVTTNNSYVIVTNPGTFTPPGGSATVATRGDFFLVSETSPGVYAWTFLNVGFDASAATTSVAGIVCLSTNALAQTGTDATTALTPAAATSAFIPKTCITAKGALISGTAANTPTALSVGTDGQALLACAACTSGLTWVTPDAVLSATPSVEGIVLGCTTNSNSALGNIALFSNTTGGANTATGAGALFYTTTGSCNTAVGSLAGCGITSGNQNLALGCGVQVASNTGSCQLAIGFSTTDNWLTGDNTKAIQPAAGIKDCTNSTGTIGQVLISNGANAICWDTVITPAATPTVVGVVFGCTTATNSALGNNALLSNTTGINNTANGVNALRSNITGCNNTATGESALLVNTGSCNTANGANALFSNTTGCLNTANGLQTLRSNTIGSFNTANGANALLFNTIGYFNTANGLSALRLNTTGCFNTANGANALYENTAGSCNTAMGQGALYVNTTGINNTANGAGALFNGNGSCNTAVGYFAGSDITSGTQNLVLGYGVQVASPTASCQLSIGFSLTENWLTGDSNKNIKPGAGIRDCASSTGTVGQVLMSNGANAICWGTAGGPAATPTVAGSVLGCTTATNSALGCNALLSNTTGSCNTATGLNALVINTTGSFNTANGGSALQNNTTGSNNTANGVCALRLNTTGCNNTANGFSALRSNTTGNFNTAIGTDALYSNATGCFNTANGVCALRLNTTGFDNTANGGSALQNNTTGFENTANGVCALRANTTGCFNTANGVQALVSNTTGNNNTAIGRSALIFNTTGCYNTANGGSALQNNTTGSGNVMVGGLNAAGTYAPVFNGTTESNRVMIGSTATTNAYVQVAWQVVSDARDKNVEGPVPHGLEFVSQLEPKAFRFKVGRDSEESNGPLRYGFLAQDIQALEGESCVIVDCEIPEKLTLHSEALVPVLVNAIKELSAKVEALEAKLAANG